MTAKTSNPSVRDQSSRPLPPPPAINFDPSLFVPDEAQCMDYWQQFSMLPNVAKHSHKVAEVAVFVAEHAKKNGLDLDVATVRAAALLHDIAKTYCIRHGGNHGQLGGAWAMDLTGNPIIAAGVTHHVFWPFELDLQRYFTPLAVIYADKRVNHDQLVSIDKRFEDLIKRYGIPLSMQDRLLVTKNQALELEHLLCDITEVDLNACDFDSGRMV